MQCEAVLLGREPVEGGVDAGAMAALIRALLQSRERISRTAGDVYRDRRRYLLRCREGIEIVPAGGKSSSAVATSASSASSTASTASSRPRRVDDEGFESDDDTASTKSATSLDDTVSNSSSCCFVDDHVFKVPACARVAATGSSSSSSVATDSANSSGASDTDDVDSAGAPSPSSSSSSSTGSVAKLVKSLTLYQRKDSPTPSPSPQPPGTATPRQEGEVYPVSDVAFCHLDPAYPNVVVWVVKRRRPPQRLSANPDTSAGAGLQAIVFECANEKALKKLCATFQEISRRAKLDQYKHPHRRKDGPGPNLNGAVAKLYHHYQNTGKDAPTIKQEKNMKLELARAYEPRPVPAVKPVQRPAPAVTAIVPRPKPAPKPTPKPVKEEDNLPAVAKFNLVQRTDGDGVTHIEVSRDASLGHRDIETIPDCGTGPSSIISISTPDAGNLLAAPAAVATSNPNAPRTRLGKEIEGVIRSDVDMARREAPRQREPAILVMNPADAAAELHKVWIPPEEEAEDEDQKDVVTPKEGTGAAGGTPPQRPERRKYVRKKNPAPPPPVQKTQQPPPPPSQRSIAPSPDPFQRKPLVPFKPETLSRSQQNLQTQQKIVRGQFIRVSVEQPAVTPVPATSSWVFGSPYSNTWSEAREHIPRRPLDDMFAVQGHTLRPSKHHRRSRSTGGGRSRSKSPPARRAPMAYRYIDVAAPPPPQPPQPTSGRFFGLSQKLRELGGAGGAHPYATTARRRGSAGEAQHLAAAAAGGGLKSVIKKSKRAGEYVEPKKVTFSAYATVQVVD